MNREGFFQELKQGMIRPCYLFEGEEEFTKEAALRNLQQLVLQGEFAQLNQSVLVNPSANELIACAETLPMMADKRFVLVKESSLLSARTGDAEGESAPSADQDRVADYVSQLPESVCLVFFHRGKASAVRKLYKRIDKLGGVVRFDLLEQSMLIRWIAQELKRSNKEIERSTAEQLVFVVGNDMHTLQSELQKLGAYVGDRPLIEADDIDKVCIKTSEYKVFDLSDAVANHQPAKAAQLMGDLLRSGEQRLMLIALLQRQYRQMLFAKVLAAARTPSDAIAKALGVPPFVARKLQGMVSREKIEDIRRAYDLLVDTEFEVKSGQTPEEGSLERAIYRILAWQQEGRHG